MGQQNLKTVVTIGGNVDNSFEQIGSALINLGSQIDQISSKLIDIGKVSVDAFVEYDDLMRETQAVGGYTAEELAQLDELNREIAQTSTYTNIESAEAMVLIAQAGKDVEDTYDLLPSVLDLSMAGNLELADSVDYLLSSLTAMNLEMEYAGILTDQMAKTAALGMTDIDTLGESMMRLGSASGEFFDSSEEILTILSVMSKFGHDQRGAEAGTWLRNFMLSLAAPTGNIDDIVDAMEQLGIAEAEIEEYVSGKSNGAAAQAVNSLIEQGLTIYDEQGKLLPAIDIIKSLRDTVRGNAGYSEDLTEMTGMLNEAGGDIDAFLESAEGLTDNALYSVFSKIFGKRGITTAMNLISISDEEWEKTFSEILNSEGFAKSMAETMQGGLGGALRELNAAATELKTTLGGIVAPGVEKAADFLHDAAVSISDMDEDTLEALVSGMTAIALAGPGIMIAGGAIRLLGTLATPVGFTAAAIVTLTAGMTALNELVRQDMADNFGEMALDMDSLSGYVEELGADFRAAYADVNSFNAALEESVTDYTNASQTFSGNLLTAMLTGAALTEADEENLRTLGEQMHGALISGITNSTASTISYWEMLFGGAGTAEYDPEYQQIIDLTNQSYQEALETAEGLSQGLRDAMTSAFEDGTVSEEEYAELQRWMQAYNDAMAQAAAEAKERENKIALEKLLFKSQTASFDSILEYASEIEEERSRILAQEEDAFLSERAGLVIDGADQSLIEAAEEKYKLRIAEVNEPYDEALRRLWGSSIQNSDLAGAYNELGALADLVLDGGLDAESAVGLFKGKYGNNAYAGENDFLANNTRTQLGEYLARMIAGYGGYEGLTEKIAHYEETGDTETAAYLRRLYAMQQINDDFAATGVTEGISLFGLLIGEGRIESSSAGEYARMRARKDTFLADIDGYITDYTADTARRTVELFSGENGSLDVFFDSVADAISSNDGRLIDTHLTAMEEKELNGIVEGLAAVYDFEKVLAEETSTLADAESGLREYIAAYSLIFGNATHNLNAYQIAVPRMAEEELTAEGIVTGLSESAQAEMEAAQAYLDGHPGTWVINAVYGGSGLPISGAGGYGIEAKQFLNEYADGGRATEASIFGEAGAEWAIPEEHTANTASLIRQATEASGFTWSEIADSGGGSGWSSGGNTLIYSPTIVAADARGVEQKLKEDKERLEKWLMEKELLDKISIYA